MRCTFADRVKNLSSYVFILLWVWAILPVFGQQPPTLRCISLDSNDDATLYWTIPIDTGGDFHRYVIYTRNNTSLPFSEVTNLSDYAVDSLLLVGNYSGFVQFTIATVSNGGLDTSAFGDTISPIVLSFGNQGNYVQFTWNATGLASADSMYNIYRRFFGSTWQLLSSNQFAERQYNDTIYACLSEVQYKVEIRGKSGCKSRSNHPLLTVEDEVPPDQNNLVCASVDSTTGFVNLEWSRSNSNDVLGYLVFYFESFVRIDTIFGADSLHSTFVTNGINALIQSETLSVAPFDSCFDSINGWYNQAADNLRFSTIFVDTLFYDRCEGDLALKWNLPQPGFPVGVRNLETFRVFRRTNQGPPELVEELTALDSVFVDKGLIPGNSYTYVVSGYDPILEKEAFSNPFTLNPKQADAPDHIYISSIVNDHTTDQNHVRVHVDSISATETYLLERSSDGKLFMDIAVLENRSREFLEFIDLDGDAQQLAYYYRIKALDECSLHIAQSPVAKNVLVQGNKIEANYENELYWDEYEGYDSAGTSVQSYDLHRFSSEEDDLTLDSNDVVFEFIDDVSQTLLLGGEICYYVEIPESGVNQYGLEEVSMSNKVCFEYPPKVFIPSAFSPDGDHLNDRFIPNVNFIDPLDYELVIFNRMGKLLFTSNNPNEGWGGQDQPLGVYAYLLKLRNSLGDELIFSGRVNLIR